MMDDIVGLLLDRAFRLATRDFNGNGARLAKEAAEEILRLRAENEKLRAAGEGVVKWWLEGGSMRLEGAPYCMFALRRALDGERAAAALKETGDE